jgi:IS30 family transposase
MGKSQTTQKKETSVKRSYHIHHAAGQHITYQMRTIIETAYNANLRKPGKDRVSMRELARQLAIPKSTLFDEIKRGTVTRPNTYRDRDIWDYSAEIAQRRIDEGNANKGCPMKMNTTVAKLLHTEIVANRRSPYDALRRLEEMGFDNLPSERCVYYHIHHGDLGISPSQLPYKPKPGRKRRQKPRRSLKTPGNLSIEERPDIDGREDFGHWEMDTVVSGVHGKGGLLVLIERKTRYYVMVRLRAISQGEVLRALRQAIRRGRIVKALTITTDNGSEFLDHKAIEGLFKANGRTKVYYTHAYAAWEKGSVENANRIVRRWYPKGTDFSKVTIRRIEQLQDAINSIHRRLLEGKTANEAYLSAA